MDKYSAAKQSDLFPAVIFASMFPIKDYFALLEVAPSASPAEIKKAYRKLAHQYHPDKHNNDPYASAKFAEIKEAYEVLTDPSKKEYYLQQRWYNQAMGRKKTKDTITPVNLLKQALELERYVSSLDVFRMDKLGLQEYILDLLQDETLEQLKSFDEKATIREIISIFLRSIRPLPPAYTEAIYTRLEALSSGDSPSIQQISEHRHKAARKHQREKYSLLLIIILTLLLCLLIWLGSR